jgi:lipopolysaccharide transport system ATP-binding protein
MTVIRVESLSKRYRLGLIGRTALHEDLARWWARLHGRPDPTLRVDQLERLRLKRASAAARAGDFKDDAEHVWALRDVTFDVQQGEVLGIIGRNGAGKSTLLKILTRVTAPTTGTVKMRGRVASLLEVGTGFHPELTGRENIFLNGTILGMRRAEVRRKFDEIVAFAEIDKFIDTPVKRYSSGMYVRLAFAIAAHLDPEILLVDEVLAVGDSEFQKKCLGKMRDVAGHGRTVLFVSHNMSAISKLCSRGLVFQNGSVLMEGDTAAAVSCYTDQGRRIPSRLEYDDPECAPGDDVVRLKRVELLDGDGQPASTIDIRKPAIVEFQYWHLNRRKYPTAILHFKDEQNNTLFATNEFNAREWKDVHREQGLITARCHVPGNLLSEGRITVLAAINCYNPTTIHVYADDAISFEVVDHSDGDGVRGPVVGHWPGLVRPWLDWETRRT